MALPLAGDPVAAADITRPRYIQKSATETRTSTIAPSNDADFVNIALPVGIWEVRAYLTALSTISTGDVRITWTFSGTVSAGRVGQGPGADTTTSVDVATTVCAVAVAITSTVIYGCVASGLPSVASGIQEELFLNVTVAGNLTMQWAQGTSNAAATSLSSSSRLIITALEAF